MSLRKCVEEFLVHRAREKSLDCAQSQQTVLSYIRASKDDRKAFSGAEVVDVFAHIYWCINNQSQCDLVWLTLKYIDQYLSPDFSDLLESIVQDPSIRNNLDQEIIELLSRWQVEAEDLEK